MELSKVKCMYNNEFVCKADDVKLHFLEGSKQKLAKKELCEGIFSLFVHGHNQVHVRFAHSEEYITVEIFSYDFTKGTLKIGLGVPCYDKPIQDGEDISKVVNLPNGATLVFKKKLKNNTISQHLYKTVTIRHEIDVSLHTVATINDLEYKVCKAMSDEFINGLASNLPNMLAQYYCSHLNLNLTNGKLLASGYVKDDMVVLTQEWKNRYNDVDNEMVEMFLEMAPKD